MSETPENQTPQTPQTPPSPRQPTPELGVRELRNNIAQSLRRAEAGERLVVTVDGRPVAQLGPLIPDHSGISLWDLASAGLVRPPRTPLPPLGERPLVSPPAPGPFELGADRLLHEVRGR